MEVYSRIEKAREVIKTALKIEEMPPDKLKRFIYKNAVDEFIKRHPEFNEELNEIIKQEEEESEEAEED